jgi:hypothetical protein
LAFGLGFSADIGDRQLDEGRRQVLLGARAERFSGRAPPPSPAAFRGD